MAKFTQEQCDASIVTREKDTSGNWFIRVTNEDGKYCEFFDTVSASNASEATSTTNAHAYLKENCEYKTTTLTLSTQPEEI